MTAPLSWWEKRTPVEWPLATELPSEADVVIVGAGFLGLWLSLALTGARPGLRVVVLERDVRGRGASTKNAGFLTCGHLSEMIADERDVPREEIVRWFLSRREGLEILLAESEGRLATQACGSIDWDAHDVRHTTLAAQLNEILRAHGRPDAFEERDAVFAGKPRRVLASVFDRAVDPVELLELLHDRAAASGIVVAHGADVRSARGGLVAAKLAVGRTAEVRAGHVFLCTNAFSAALHESTRIVPGRGQVIVTTPVEPTTTPALGFLRNGYDYFRFVDGRLLIGGGRHVHAGDERTTSLDTTTALARYLVRAAQEVLGHDRFQIEHQWSGIMGFYGGKHLGGSGLTRGRAGEGRVMPEVMKPVDAKTSALFACGGMGVALAPKVARDVAQAFFAA